MNHESVLYTSVTKTHSASAWLHRSRRPEEEEAEEVVTRGVSQEDAEWEEVEECR